MISVSDDTLILTISAQDFKKTFGEPLKKIKEFLIETLRKVPIFSNWNLAHLSGMYQHFVKMNCEFGTVIYKQGTENAHLYFIISGEVEVS